VIERRVKLLRSDCLGCLTGWVNGKESAVQ
jgi:hypothetical protein